MKQGIGPMIAVWTSVVLSLGVVALLMAFAVEKANFVSIVRECVAVVEASDVEANVIQDVRSGKSGFYYDRISEWDLAGDGASGIFDDRVKTCRRPKDAYRPWPFGHYARYRQIGRNGRIWAQDPIYSPRTDCGRAVISYMHEYNGTLARLHPTSIEKYCK